nr:immunoglobulin light chain junction region [Macaca mulatta]MOY04335.1 immunoglobulin light chain junction region [Macaca mulatta]
CMQCLEFPWTF